MLKQPSANPWNLEVDRLIKAPMKKKTETKRYERSFWLTLSTTPLYEYVILNTDLIVKFALSIDKHRRKRPGLDNLITATGLKDLHVLLRNLSPDLGN